MGRIFGPAARGGQSQGVEALTTSAGLSVMT
jgi:hypothetical protein